MIRSEINTNWFALSKTKYISKTELLSDTFNDVFS